MGRFLWDIRSWMMGESCYGTVALRRLLWDGCSGTVALGRLLWDGGSGMISLG